MDEGFIIVKCNFKHYLTTRCMQWVLTLLLCTLKTAVTRYLLKVLVILVNIDWTFKWYLFGGLGQCTNYIFFLRSVNENQVECFTDNFHSRSKQRWALILLAWKKIFDFRKKWNNLYFLSMKFHFKEILGKMCPCFWKHWKINGQFWRTNF